MSAAKIITTNVYPPIPMRQFDWCAYRDGYEPPDSDGVGGGLIGWGRTEAAAIADLKEQEDEATPETPAHPAGILSAAGFVREAPLRDGTLVFSLPPSWL